MGARPPDRRRDAALWHGLTRASRWLLRNSPVGVVLQLPDGTQHTARPGEPAVTVVGEPAELVLYTFGRARCGWTCAARNPTSQRSPRGSRGV